MAGAAAVAVVAAVVVVVVAAKNQGGAVVPVINVAPGSGNLRSQQGGGQNGGGGVVCGIWWQYCRRHAGGAGGTDSGVNSDGGVNYVTTYRQTVDISARARLFFSTLGVNLTLPGKSIFFNDRLGELFVRATSDDLDTIENAIEVLNHDRATNSHQG